MDTDALLRAVEEVLELSRDGDASAAAGQRRLALAADRHPELVEKFPKLIDMCCAATTPDRAASVRLFLPLMVAQIRSLDAGATTFEDASAEVGRALGERYLPPPESAAGGGEKKG